MPGVVGVAAGVLGVSRIGAGFAPALLAGAALAGVLFSTPLAGVARSSGDPQPAPSNATPPSTDLGRMCFMSPLAGCRSSTPIAVVSSLEVRRQCATVRADLAADEFRHLDRARRDEVGRPPVEDVCLEECVADAVEVLDAA